MITVIQYIYKNTTNILVLMLINKKRLPLGSPFFYKECGNIKNPGFIEPGLI